MIWRRLFGGGGVDPPRWIVVDTETSGLEIERDALLANILATTVPLDGKVPILNVGTGVETSVNDLVRLLGEAAGSPLEVRHDAPRPGEQRRSALDAGLAARLLGWRPLTDVRTGLAQTLAWFRDAAGRSESR